jgi:hypothetical protein
MSHMPPEMLRSGQMSVVSTRQNIKLLQGMQVCVGLRMHCWLNVLAVIAQHVFILSSGAQVLFDCSSCVR